MAETFGDLVDWVTLRLQPMRMVTPHEYRAITCNRCGFCCEDIRAADSPEEVAVELNDPSTNEDRRRFLAGLIPVGEAPNGWRYRCRHFARDADGLGLCTIHETRPNVCRGFPYGTTVRSWPQCSWYVQIRDADGTLLPALPEMLEQIRIHNEAVAAKNTE